MFCKRFINKFIIKTLSFLFLIVSISAILCLKYYTVNASMPFYNLKPQNLVLRSRFYTSYSLSTDERKNNIKIASNALDKTFIDVNAEFSFNAVVGARTEKRGYKKSKVIVGGEFVDGVGGGVCQVSTTLYNALLLAGLKITEYHPHSLAVSYVSPSFDAMVSYNFADLKFVNNTDNPIILHTITTNDKITVEIFGEPNEFSYLRQSVIREEIPAPKELEVLDIKGEYPELYEGQKKFIKYSKSGLKSQGVIVKLKDGKVVSNEKIRSDTYSATQGLVIMGTTTLPENDSLIEKIINITKE